MKTRVPLYVLAGLLFIAGLPDAMVVPVLRGLTVDRYGMSEGGAHLFISASLVGATIVAGFASRLRRRFGLKRVVCISAAMNAVLLITMAFPIGAFATLCVRVVEGGADLMVYAVLFDRIASSGHRAQRGARLGLAATTMMIGIATGILLGGVIGRTDPAMVLVAGGLACMGLSLLGALLPLGEPDQSVRAYPLVSERSRMMVPMLQIFADRATAGLLVTTAPLFLARELGFGSAGVGSRVGTIMLVMAIGIWPMGRLVDRKGPWKVRAVCTIAFVLSIACLPVLMDIGAWSLLACACIGVFASGLFASAIVLASRARNGAGGMASFYTAGNAGFFVGPLLAGVLVSGFAAVGTSPFAATFVAFAFLHAGCTVASRWIASPDRATDPGGAVRETGVTTVSRAA